MAWDAEPLKWGGTYAVIDLRNSRPAGEFCVVKSRIYKQTKSGEAGEAVARLLDVEVELERAADVHNDG